MLIKTGSAFFGKQWQSEMAENLNVNPRVIRYWVAGEREVPSGLENELIALGEIRKAQIDSAVNALKAHTKPQKIDLSKTVITVSENGYVYDEVFETLKDAQAFAQDAIDADDLYLVKYYEMSLEKHSALLTIQYFSDVCDPQTVLSAIESGKFEKSSEEYFRIIANIHLDAMGVGKAYYAYFLKNELCLNCESNIYEPHIAKTMTYKQYALHQLSQLIELVADIEE